MGKLVDLTDMKFNKLTVIGLDVEKNKKIKEERNNGKRKSGGTFWICKCERGNEISVNGCHLKSNHTKSCGCSLKKYNFEELVGTKVNDLFVRKLIKIEDKYFLECECKCGSIKLYNPYNVVNNSSCNCGCGRKETNKKNNFPNLEGERFGKLLVIEKTNERDKNRRIIYKCICECGNMTTATSNELMSCHKLSCGCIDSKNNLKIANILSSLNVNFEREKYFKYMNSYGRFDIFIPDLQIAIEYDGEQHFKPIDFAGKGEEWAKNEFEKIKKRDEIKNEYCKINEIKLLRIPYWECNNIEKIIIDFLHRERLNEKTLF